MDRTLEELLAAAWYVDGGLFWPEVLTEGERRKIRRYLMELYGIGE
jgi:hypothetical protein